MIFIIQIIIRPHDHTVKTLLCHETCWRERLADEWKNRESKNEICLCGLWHDGQQAGQSEIQRKRERERGNLSSKQRHCLLSSYCCHLTPSLSVLFSLYDFCFFAEQLTPSTLVTRQVTMMQLTYFVTGNKVQSCVSCDCCFTSFSLVSFNSSEAKAFWFWLCPIFTHSTFVCWPDRLIHLTHSKGQRERVRESEKEKEMT